MCIEFLRGRKFNIRGDVKFLFLKYLNLLNVLLSFLEICIKINFFGNKVYFIIEEYRDYFFFY